MEPWHIRVSPWVIQDGNYANFRRGQIADFALEFYSPHGFRPVKNQEPKAVRLAGCRYQVIAKVVYSAGRTFVLDFGIQAYQDGTEPPPEGSMVEGEIYLSIDSYLYFEWLSAKPSMPALIYQWRVDRILKESAPLVYGEIPFMGRGLIRGMVWDEARKKVEEVDRTDAWHDESKAEWDVRRGVSYILVCILTDAKAGRAIQPGDGV